MDIYVYIYISFHGHIMSNDPMRRHHPGRLRTAATIGDGQWRGSIAERPERPKGGDDDGMVFARHGLICYPLVI